MVFVEKDNMIINLNKVRTIARTKCRLFFVYEDGTSTSFAFDTEAEARIAWRRCREGVSKIIIIN